MDGAAATWGGQGSFDNHTGYNFERPNLQGGMPTVEPGASSPQPATGEE